MSVEPASPNRLDEVLLLCTQLADRALDALIMGCPVPAEQIAALAKAARLLQDHGVEWPPLLAQVIHDLATDATEPKATSAAPPAPAPVPDALGEADVAGLTRFFAGFRRDEQS